MPVPDLHKLSSSRFAVGEPLASGRPTAWARILVGATLMLVAVAAADKVRNGAQKYTGGMLRVTTQGQARFITWQLAVFGVLGGGVLAGAGTGSGVRHGLMAGAMGGVGVVALSAALPQPLSPVLYWLGTLSLGDAPTNDPAAIGAAIGGVLLLGVVGGWLGGTLLQPLAPEGMRRKLHSNVD
jgi:hypothetical protein